jgi:hypothetical protein
MSLTLLLRLRGLPGGGVVAQHLCGKSVYSRDAVLCVCVCVRARSSLRAAACVVFL